MRRDHGMTEGGGKSDKQESEVRNYEIREKEPMSISRIGRPISRIF
jgi:hypothetical protein